MLAVAVMCGTLMGSYQEAQAAGLSAGALQYGLDLSFLESLFMAGGLSLGLDMLLKTQNDINNWDWGDVLDSPASQGQIDSANEKIESLYNNAVKDWYDKHGGSSKPTPTPMITEPPAPGVTPPVTVAPINPDDVTMPDDWATMKKNATDKGVLAMGPATAYCVKEAVKGWWDDIMQTDSESNVSGNPYKNDKYIGYLQYDCTGVYNGVSYTSHRKAYVYDKGVNNDLSYIGTYFFPSSSVRLSYHDFTPYKSNGDMYYFCNSYVVESVTYDDARGTVLKTFKGSNIYNYNDSIDYGYSGGTSIESYAFSVPVVIDGKTIPASALPPGKSSMWPSTDLKDDYDNNRSPNLPELVTPTLRLPTLDEIKDFWKQGTDDEENRPTYVTNFITNHTVQPTPEPEPTKKPEVNPNPGGGTDPDPNPTPSTTPAVNPDPGGGTDPDPNPDPNPDPDPDNPDPDNPDPTPEEEASPYKADLREIFPFCIPFDLIHLFKVFDAEPEAPVFKFPLDLELDNPWTDEKVVDYHHEFEFDFSDYEDLIKLLRIIQIVAFITGLMMITRQQMIKG